MSISPCLTVDAAPARPLHDLNAPDYDPVDCPSWIKETLPSWVLPFRGLNGLPPAIGSAFHGVNAPGVAGVDRYQANQFVTCRPETVEYLYQDYTSLEVRWPKGFLPLVLQLAQEATQGLVCAEEKAIALMERVSRTIRHPWMAPSGEAVLGDRAMDEELLIESGTAWCNEQARIFVRLCQAVGVPARIIHLFYTKAPTGHTVAEFHNGERWCMIDLSYFLVFRDGDGRLLSAQECHEEGRAVCEGVYRGVFEKLLATARRLYAHYPEEKNAQRIAHLEGALLGNEMCLDAFAVINYPLPSVA